MYGIIIEGERKMTREEYIETMENAKSGKITITSTEEIAFESEQKGTIITGIMYSTDEMWDDTYGFYAEVITDDAIYTCYYNVNDDQELNDIDYSKPWAIVKHFFDEEL